MITVKEIAQICNVSASTVSNILNGKPNVGEDTRRRVLEVVAQTGYQPNYFAQSMRKQSNRMISIVVEDLDEFSTAPIVESAMAYCDDMGYRTILMNLRLYDKWKATWYDDDEKVKQVLKPAIQELQSIRVDGLIYIAGHCRTSTISRRILRFLQYLHTACPRMQNTHPWSLMMKRADMTSESICFPWDTRQSV